MIVLSFMFLNFFMLLLMCRFKMAMASLCKCDSGDKNLLVPEGYNKHKTPLEEINQPTAVYISIEIMDIDEILEERMEYSMQFYVNEYWKDERLNKSVCEKDKLFRIPREWMPDLWMPDTIFENSKGGWIYPLSVPNVVVQIRSLNYLHRFTRYNMKFTCAMQLRNYPMDTQHCFFITTSLAYTNEKMAFKWLHEMEDYNLNEPDIRVANLKPLKYHVSKATPLKIINQFPEGNATALYANFTFIRHLSSHIMNVYIPSGLVVILAFLTFWLNVRSVPARVALGLTSLLTLSTQASQARNNLPPINYLTALDIWLFTCMMLVFSSLLEYATVYHLYNEKIRKRKNYELAATASQTWATNRSDRVSLTTLKGSGNKDTIKNSAKSETDTSKKNEPPLQEFEEESQPIDKISRILFPSFFFVFSMIYWIHFSCT